jgi:hypothetical protein
VHVTDECTVNKFNSEEVDMLRRWVSGGGILWANNDVLTLFSIKHSSDYWLQGSQECQSGVLPQVCPVMTGCSRVVVTKRYPAARNLSYMNVIPLLTCSLRGNTYTYWSLVKYGNGWVSDAKTVDQTKYDGARFWLNFRLFCLGWDIPGAEELEVTPGIVTVPEPITPPQTPIQLPNTRGPHPTRITNPTDLKKSLAADSGQRIIWVALSQNEVDLETRKKLRAWIYGGGTFWIETDLAELFGFGGLSKSDPYSLSGQAEVARVQDPIVFGLSGEVLNYELDPNGSIIKGIWSTISRNMRPLLVQPDTQNNIITVVCAVREYGDGLVILRPAKIDTSSRAGMSFESVLNSVSMNPSRYKLPTPEPVRKRRTSRPSVRRR